MKRYLFLFSHSLDILWIPIICFFIIPFGVIFLLPSRYVKYPEQREEALKSYKKLYPINLFKEWLEGFNDERY